MRILINKRGYNYWYDITENGETFYNVTDENSMCPSGGYYDSDYICKIKRVPNLFKTVNKNNHEHTTN